MKPDRIQIESLWQTSAIRLRRFLYRLTGDFEIANDLLNQTFLEATRYWNRYQGKGSRQSWIFGIARNLARLEFRKRQSQKEDPFLIDIPCPEQIDRQIQDEKVHRMWSAIQGLPEILRKTLLLRLVDEMTYDEIAGALDIPIGTVRSRIHEGIRKLRQELNPLHKE